jgi:hypothetical protein
MSNATLPVIVEDANGGERAVGIGSMSAGPGFFEVMQIPIIFGRAIDARDRRDTPRVAVITESMARRQFGGPNAVGRRFRVDWQGQVPQWIEVVGVVRDTGSADLTSELTDQEPQIFFYSVEQPVGPDLLGGGRTIVARTSGDALGLVRDLQRELLAIDPSLPVLSAMTMAERLEDSLEGPRAVAMSLGALGVLGLLLAGIGLYAVIAFAVARRSREIGIRMALGARSSDVVRDVARDVAVVLGGGAAVGLTASLLVILAMRNFSNFSSGMANIDLYRPSVDPVQLAAIAAFIIVVGVVAAFVPARRASRMSPLSALRQE